jgi:hypothetical protein
VGANPTRQLSLQPVGIGAGVEVTKQLKPSVSGVAKADARDRQQRLRVVRHLPVRAELSKPGEAWGQVLDKPSGRKPRGRADAGQQDRGSMEI